MSIVGVDLGLHIADGVMEGRDVLHEKANPLRMGIVVPGGRSYPGFGLGRVLLSLEGSSIVGTIVHGACVLLIIVSKDSICQI